MRVGKLVKRAVAGCAPDVKLLSVATGTATIVKTIKPVVTPFQFPYLLCFLNCVYNTFVIFGYLC